MNLLGVDLSSRAIDLVLLDENTDDAHWTRIQLDGKDAFERTRDVPAKMPRLAWYDANGVYLIALERPFVRFGQDVIRLVQGAVLACLPRHIQTWEVTPSQWKPLLHIGIRDKPVPGNYSVELQMSLIHEGDPWPQDALDALGVALYARDTNHKAITSLLQERRPA